MRQVLRGCLEGVVLKTGHVSLDRASQRSAALTGDADRDDEEESSNKSDWDAVCKRPRHLDAWVGDFFSLCLSSVSGEVDCLVQTDVPSR